MIQRIVNIIALFLISGSMATVFAQNYSIPEVSVDVEIKDDGTVYIAEQYLYQFSGSFSWAELSIPMHGFSEIRDIRVSEQEQDYINENTEEPGTFSVARSDNSVQVRWHYSAEDTSRVFTVSYTITEAISSGPDVSEFFWNYLSSSRDKSTDRFNINITLPEAVPVDQMHAWSRIPGERTEIETEEGKFSIQAHNISRRESAEIRILFPTTVFNEEFVNVTDSSLTLASVVAEEEQIAKEAAERAEREAFYASITKEATVIISLLSFGLFFFIYRKYGKRHSTGTVSSRETLVIPSQHPPALVGRLLTSNMTTGNHLVATIFDLARRGWFVIREENKGKEENGGWFSFSGSKDNEFTISAGESEPSAKPEKFERSVIDFINIRIGNGKNKFSDLFSGSDSEASKWYTKWKTEVKEHFDEQNWIDAESYKGVAINVIGQMILLAVIIYILIMGTDFAFIGAGITGIMALASFGIIRRTKTGEETYQRWKAYNKGLKNADKRTVRMEMLDRHFIYATAFHLSESNMNILLESTDQQTTSTLFPWIILAHSSVATPASVAKSVTALAATGTSSFSSVTGGGGAVSGSAGGGSSASAG